jgi:DNA (cytosine-5)-methyltransferase 1
MREIKYGSLCTGYDGLGMALTLAGLPVAPQWLAEVEDDMSLVLKHEHPEVPNVGDIKSAPWHLAPHVDLMSSGDPCQSISIAGRQAGRDDPRFLWPWVREAYRAVRPGGIFFENVANIVSHDKGRTLAERHEHLREDGYAVRWTVLGACAVGAPHHRHRYYAVAGRWTGPGPVPEAVRVGGNKAICGAPRSGGRFLLPSPMARDGDGRGEGDPAYWQKRLAERGRTQGMPLGAAVNLLPTPDASMSTRGGMLSPSMAEIRAADPRRSTNLDDAIAALLPSPTARDGSSGPGRTAAREGGDDLRTLVTLLPTPRASDGENGRGNPGQVYGSGSLPLSGAVSLLPTPMVGDATGGHSEPVTGGVRPSGAKRMDSLGSVAPLLPTPMADRSGTNVGGAAGREGQAVRPSLDSVHRLLPTPTAGDGDRGTNSMGSTGSPMLGAAVRPEVWGKFAEAVALWEMITGVPAPAPTEPGAKGGRRLSPLLPEWMMGLRPGLLADRLGRPAALKGAGNGVVPLAAAAAYRLCTE